MAARNSVGTRIPIDQETTFVCSSVRYISIYCIVRCVVCMHYPVGNTSSTRRTSWRGLAEDVSLCVNNWRFPSTAFVTAVSSTCNVPYFLQTTNESAAFCRFYERSVVDVIHTSYWHLVISRNVDTFELILVIIMMIILTLLNFSRLKSVSITHCEQVL